MQLDMEVLTLNIHKGFSASTLRYTLEALRVALRQSGSNLVFLQEVSGENRRQHRRLTGWPSSNQLEYLADNLWPHTAYGQNAVTSNGHHGNAIMSAIPIVNTHNQDLSLHRISQRGALHATLENGLELLSVHLGLFERERQRQLDRLIDYIHAELPPAAPLILAGDFNDWRGLAHRRLCAELDLEEAYFSRHGRLAKTFPAQLPLVAVDRIYSRGLSIVAASLFSSPLWRRLSDHRALGASFARRTEVHDR